MNKPLNEDFGWTYLALALFAGIPLYFWILSLSNLLQVAFLVLFALILLCSMMIWYAFFSKIAVEKKNKRNIFQEIPVKLREPSEDSILLGKESDLTVPIYFPASIRSRHVHILGSTGAGKTESVILNFLKQDIAAGRGAIILDAKGDDSFQENLKKWLPPEKIGIVDLSNEK